MIDPSGIDRRAFLARTAAGAAALTVPGVASAAPSVAKPIGLPTPARMRADIQQMVDFGARYTGTDGHNAFIDWLEEELVAAGVVMLPREEFGLEVWEAYGHGLELLEGDGKGPVKVSSYFPRSKETPDGGITGPLVYAGVAPLPSLDLPLEGVAAALSAYPAQLTSWAKGLSGTLTGIGPGAILLVDMPMPVPLTTAPFVALSTHLQWAGHDIEDWLLGDYKRTALAPGITGVPLAPFEALGAAGVVFILDAPYDAVRGGYMPFENAFEDIPALFVDRDTGTKLRAQAASTPNARLKLTATRREGKSEALLGYLPGTGGTDEILFVDTHTDGEGFVEENGGVGIVNLARHFGSLPARERLKRTLVFSLWPGHMASGMPQLGGILENHPELVRSAAAAITVEHLGCSEWLDTADRGYHPTGEAEFFAVFTSAGKTLDIARAATIAADLPHTALLRAAGIQFGVGGALQNAGVPQIGYLAGPAYLLNDNPTSDMEKLDEKLAARQVAWTADLLRRFDAAGFDELAAGDPFLGKRSAGPRAKLPAPPPIAFGARLRHVRASALRSNGRLQATLSLNRIGPVHLKLTLEHQRGGRAVTTPVGDEVVRFARAGSVSVGLDLSPNGLRAVRRASKGKIILTARFREAGVTRVRRARLALR